MSRFNPSLPPSLPYLPSSFPPSLPPSSFPSFFPLSISPPSTQGDVWEVYHDIASYLLQSTSENVPGKKHHRHHVHVHKQSSPIHRTTSQLLEVMS